MMYNNIGELFIQLPKGHMPFPKSKRVSYKKSPLQEVICQVRFPPILSIDVDVPALFQDTIRKDYPYFNDKEEIQIKIPEELSDRAPAELIEISSPNTNFMEILFLVHSEARWHI